MRNELIFLLPFFVGALSLSHKRWDEIPDILGLLMIVVFVCSLHFYSFETSLYSMNDHRWTISYFTDAIIRLSAGFSGSLAFIYLCRYLHRVAILSRYMVFWGSISLPIYVLHQKFLMIGYLVNLNTTNYLLLFIYSIAIILLSIGVYKVLREKKCLRLIMFGEK